jgi:5-enolpyruvylshikimate-3-phosphate synthase
MDSIETSATGSGSGVIRLPGSKSISNRMLLLAALGGTDAQKFATCSIPTIPA